MLQTVSCMLLKGNVISTGKRTNYENTDGKRASTKERPHSQTLDYFLFPLFCVVRCYSRYGYVFVLRLDVTAYIVTMNENNDDTVIIGT